MISTRRFARALLFMIACAPGAFVAASCVPEVGTATRGSECEGPGSKPCRGNLECIAGRCACRTDVCNGGNCNFEGECIASAPGPSFPTAQKGPAFPTAQPEPLPPSTNASPTSTSVSTSTTTTTTTTTTTGSSTTTTTATATATAAPTTKP